MLTKEQLSEHQYPEDDEQSVISPDEALRLYRLGVFKVRHPKPMIIGGGRNANSYDFRGVGAAMSVVGTLPSKLDSVGHRLPVDPQELEAHMDSGLAAIVDSGNWGLADDFVTGYKRMAKAFGRPQELTSLDEKTNPTK